MSENLNRFLFPSNKAVVHDLTILYLKNQDLSKLSISELTQKYTDINNEIEKSFKEQKANTVEYI